MRNRMRAVAAGTLMTLVVMTSSATHADAKKKASGRETPPAIIRTEARSSVAGRLENSSSLIGPKRIPVDNPLDEVIGWIESSILWAWQQAN